MSKRKLPKGAGGKCFSLLTDGQFEDAVNNFGNQPRGSQYGLSWAEGQLQDIEWYMAKLDMHRLRNYQMTQVVQGHTKNAYRGAQGVLRPDEFHGMSFSSVEAKGMAIRGKLSSILSDMMDKYRPRHLGFSRDREGMRNMIREIFGKATGDQDAAQYAQAWKKMGEYTRQRLEANMARIGKLDDWGMPQYHDPNLVAKATPEEWAKFIMDHADLQRMADETGLNEAELGMFLRDETYHNIITEGAHKIDLERVSGRPQGRGLLTQLGEHRFIHFKDAESWMAYQDRFGTQDYLTAMTDFIDRQSMNIAAMEVLGPDPNVGYQHLRNLARKGGATKRQLNELDILYKNVMGQVGTASPSLATKFSAIRAFNIPAHLGNSTLSMITDPHFIAMTARINDIPVVKTLMRGLRILAQQGVGDTSQLKFAAQIGFTAEYAMDRAIAAARFTDTSPSKFMHRVSDITMRLNLMHPITIANRAAFQLEYAAALARDRGKSFSKLSKKRQDALRRAQITPKMWDDIRKKGVTVRNGVEYIDVNKVGAGSNREEATRLFALMHHETDMAVPTPRGETRAIVNRGMMRGTPEGEAARSLGEFKSFAISLFMTHWRRAANQNAMNRKAYGASMMVGLLALGYVALAAKEVSKGRDVPNIINEDGTPNLKLMVAILAQSGGLGIYGDLALQDYTRFGASMAETLAGPTLGLGTDAVATFQQGTKALAEYAMSDHSDEEWQKFKTQLGRNIQTYKPEIWQTRALQDRAINRFIDSWLDDQHYRKLDRAERRRDKEQGQENFWADDEWLPHRPPGIAEGADSNWD